MPVTWFFDFLAIIVSNTVWIPAPMFVEPFTQIELIASWIISLEFLINLGARISSLSSSKVTIDILSSGFKRSYT